MTFMWSHELGYAWRADDMATGFRDCKEDQYECRWNATFDHVRIALSPLLKFFLQLGHTLDTVPSDAFSSVKCTSTSDLSEYECRDSSVDPGQIGVNLTALLAVISSASVPGVKEGTQNEGRADLDSF